MHSQRTSDAPGADFTGTWITNIFEEMQLEQTKTDVSGTYTGRGGGTISGTVQGNLLHFSWQDKEAIEGTDGWGFLRMMTSRTTLAGLWGFGGDKTNNESIRAELLQRPSSTADEEWAAQNKTDLKYRGIELTAQGQYEQALPVLKRALELYREELQNEFTPGVYQLDEIHIQARLLQCYFGLADYQGVPETPQVAAQQKRFYKELLEYLRSSVQSYQAFLQETFQSRTTSSIKKLQKLADALKDWRWWGETSIAALREGHAQNLRIPRLLTLDAQLEQSYNAISAARDGITALTQQSFGKPEALSRAFTLLETYTEQVRQSITSDIEKIQALGVDWPPEERRLLEQIAAYLQVVPLEMKGESRLIRQAKSNAQEHVDYVWEPAFDLSQWLERWRSRLLTDTAKIEALEEGQFFFQQLIQFFVDFDNGAEALTLSERARARAFADLLAVRASRQESTGRIVVGHSQVTTDQPVTKEEIVQIVQERHSFIIEYFFTQTKLVIWTITSAGDIATTISSVSRKDLELLVEEFSHLVQELEYSDQKSVRLFEILHQLYHALIIPVADQLAALPKEEVITIIPHSQLFLVPFSALRDEQGVFLIEKYALVYSPAIAILEYTRQNAAHVIHQDKPNLLAFVNPIDNLVSAEQDFDAITRFYATAQQNAIYRRQKASKEVLEQQASNYTVLCFVTHAQAFDESPLDSYLALAPATSDDGRLKVPAIFRLELHTDLVILGACETGRGKITGDGVNGLSRAFLSAGTPTLLMSLWPVGENESVDQLYQFHEFWRDGCTSKAEALRQAQLEALANHPTQPEIWAGFALIGEWN